MCKLFLISVVVATEGSLTRKPKNAIGLQKDPIILECFTDSAYITWLYDSLSRQCTSLDDRFTTTSSSNATHCSLVVQGTRTTRLSGSYRCNDRTEAADAVVIVIGQYMICHSFIHVYSGEEQIQIQNRSGA